MLLPLRLIAQYIERGLQFAPGVRIADNIQATTVIIPGFVQTAQLFKRLPTVIVPGGVVRIALQQRCEFGDRFFQVAFLDVSQRQSVTGKRTARILDKKLLKLFDSGGQASGYRIQRGGRQFGPKTRQGK